MKTTNFIQSKFPNLMDLSGSSPIYFADIVMNIAILVVLTFLVSFVYRKYGRGFSNRSVISSNFFLLSITTMLVILVVKSSLALSLGLVGALSIIRFRTAIKDPEEISYLFLSIAIGLGLGADQRLVTIFIIVVACAIIAFKKHFIKDPSENKNLYLTIRSKNEPFDASEVIEMLKAAMSNIDLKNYTVSEESNELSFYVEFDSFERLLLFENEVKSKYKQFEISFSEPLLPSQL
ncbi:MAG: DUF4956 domain-containing protein [Candidatus Margulisbacteria bacterium]|nr:DUF4956 domain-containing protein [Candidatus Margulisiibacteriota bacterium]